MLQRLCEVWGGGQRGEAFLGCSLKAEKRGEGRPASTDVPDRRRGASLHRDAAARPRLREPQTSPLSAPRAVHGGRGWVQRRAEGLRAQCSPGAAIRADTGRAPPCGPTAAPELSRRLHNSGGWGGRGAEGGAARGQRMDTDTWTREHGHTDTGTRTRGSTQPSGPCRAHSCAAGLRPRDSTRGLDGGGGEGAQQRGHPRRPPPGPLGGLRAGVAVPVPAPGPSPEPRGRGHLSPRSRRGAGLTWRGARLRAAAGPAARPPCSPPAAAWDLRGGGGGVGAQASGPGGAERSGRPAALLPPTPTPRSVPVRRCVASLLGPRVSVYIVRPLRHRTARPRRSRRPSAPRAPRRAFNGPGRARGTPPALKGPRRSRGGKTQRERDARGDR